MDAALDDDFCVSIGADGSIEGTLQAIDTTTRCYDDAVADGAPSERAELVRDCEFAASPLSGLGDTFWIGAGATPRCALESLALDVFRRHAGRSPRAADPKSGAEWWVQCKDPASAAPETREIGFHWDKDERAHALHGIYVFPQLSTVTYLTDGGAPTVVLEKRPDTFSGAIDAEPAASGAMCPPRAGRHLVFDGRHLHAAPRVLGADAGRRVTFLVNVWLAHRPSGIRPLPEAALERMRRDCFAKLTFDGPEKYPVSARFEGELRTLEFPFSRVGSRHTVVLRLPEAVLPASAFTDLVACRGEARVELSLPSADAGEDAAPGRDAPETSDAAPADAPEMSSRDWVIKAVGEELGVGLDEAERVVMEEIMIPGTNPCDNIDAVFASARGEEAKAEQSDEDSDPAPKRRRT